MFEWIRNVGQNVLDMLRSLGSCVLFALKLLRTLPKRENFSEQLYQMGILSLPIIGCAGLFVGMVLGFQSYHSLSRFGAEEATGPLIALSLFRELGPVISALLFAGRAGSALTAELALMQATEQIDALTVMGVDPMARVVTPRFWGALCALPLLALIFNAVALLGGSWIVVSELGLDSNSFWGYMHEAVDFYEDCFNGLVKSTIFGLVIATLACWQGYYARTTVAGIGYATTRTVVYSSLVVLLGDFVLTAIMF